MMRRTLSHSASCIAVSVLGGVLAAPLIGSTIYNNLTPNNQMAMASRPDTGVTEIESADDFFLGAPGTINSGSFIGLGVPGTSGNFSVADITIEIYRVFPLDSDTTRTPNVPTRTNSPSDVAFASKDSAAGDLLFSTSELDANFTALNSIQPGGIHKKPLNQTGGDGSVSGEEIQFNFTFTTPLDLPADHYFFIPQVTLTNGAQFYWLSASRPISGAGTTPFPSGVTDLQAWTRDANLDPDWLRVGTDIVGTGTFNAAFSLDGVVTPEPSFMWLILAGGVAIVGYRRYISAR